MFTYYKIPVYRGYGYTVVSGIQMMYTTVNGMFFLYDFKAKCHVKFTKIHVELCGTSEGFIEFTENINYGTSTEVLKYINKYEDYDEYREEIEKYSMMWELVS